MASQHMRWFWTQLAAFCLVTNIAFTRSQSLYFNGRFPPQKLNEPVFPIRLTWASSSVFVPLQGSGSVTVPLSSTTANGSSQIEVRLDNKLVESATINSTAPINVTVPVLGPGPHLLVVKKITESMFGEANLNNVYLNGPRFDDTKKTLSNRRMEIIGASVANGFGDIGQFVGCDPAPWFRSEDSLMAFGPLAASHFGARFAQIARFGAGILPATNGPGFPTIPQLYSRTFPGEATSTWDFASFAPQVVVFDMGANDFNTGTAAPGWADAYRALMHQVRSNAPDAEFIVMGLPADVLAGYNPIGFQNFDSNLTAVIGGLHDEGFQRLHLLQVPSSVMTDGRSCLGHPTNTTQAAIGEILQDFIGNLTGWTPVANQGSPTSIFIN